MRVFIVIISSFILTANAMAQRTVDPFDYANNREMTVQVVDSRQADSLVTFEKIVLSTNDSKIPFYYYQNDRSTDQRYTILLHGLGSSKEVWVYPSEPYYQWTINLTTIKDSLLALGHHIIIPDAKYHGERSYELNFRNTGALPPEFSKSRDDAVIFYDLYVSTIKEVRLMMDYFESLNNESKPEFNLIGYSMGGGISLLLNAVDERINCVVACVPPLGRPYTELSELNWTGEIANKMKTISPLFYAENQKAPVTLLMGQSDPFIPVAEAREFYRQLPMQDKDLIFYSSGHELPTEYIQHVLQWIRQYNE